MAVAAAVAGVLLLAGVTLALTVAFLLPWGHTPPPVAVNTPAPPAEGVPTPPPPTRVALTPAPAGVAVRQEADGLHVRTANYEAVVDADGGLNSLRVGGVEFLKPGDALEGGQSRAKGAYFFSLKDGHHGAVRLPHIERPADNVIVASGDKFHVRYEFDPYEVVMKPNNNTDDTVPFYVLLDTATVTDVLIGPDQRDSCRCRSRGSKAIRSTRPGRPAPGSPGARG